MFSFLFLGPCGVLVSSIYSKDGVGVIFPSLDALSIGAGERETCAGLGREQEPQVVVFPQFEKNRSCQS